MSMYNKKPNEFEDWEIKEGADKDVLTIFFKLSKKLYKNIEIYEF